MEVIFVLIEAIVPKLEFRVKFYPSDVCGTIFQLNVPYDFAAPRPTDAYRILRCCCAADLTELDDHKVSYHLSDSNGHPHRKVRVAPL